MKNYYDELEVSKIASKEVIEKVYKVLAKRYHPDTTKETDKNAAEEKFKAISEAYEILSDDEKRKKYDLELEQTNPTISYEEYINVVNQRDALNNSLNNLRNQFNNSNTSRTTNSQNGYYSNMNNQNYYSNVSSQSTNYQNYTNQNTNNYSNKKTYYYSDGRPASAFAYFKYRMKNFFTNVGLLLLSILAAILIINAFSNFNLFSLFLNN